MSNKPGTFKKGDPRINRVGRRKGSDDIRTTLKKLGKELVKGTNITKAEAVLRNIIDGAVAGNDTKQRYYLEYMYGKPVQSIDVGATIAVADYSEKTMEFAQLFLSKGGDNADEE